MIKGLMACRTNNYLHRILSQSYSFFRLQTEPHKTPKAYQALLRNNIENSIKFPSSDMLKTLRSRGITKIMASNHTIEQTDLVLEAHVECLYALIHRIQPSIEAISMFTETIYDHIDSLRNVDITVPSLLNLLKPTILTKIVKIAQVIDGFYNESFRSLISVLIIKLLQQSTKNQVKNRIETRRLAEDLALALKGKKEIKDGEGNLVKAQNLDAWQRQKTNQIKQNYRFLNELDYWNGFQFVLSMQYYTDDFLLTNMTRLQKSLEKDLRTLDLSELMVKIKSIVQLHRFKNHKQVGGKGLRTLFLTYNKFVDQYFKLLSQEPSLLEYINNQEPIIQVQLLKSFLTQDHYERAKKVYMDIFKSALNVSNNGVLLVDIKRLKGFFEVILILYGHEDTKDIHDLLSQLQKVMIMYPLERFDKLEAHCYVCEKFGFKSDVFADKFLKYLLQQKEKLDRNRGHLHHVHQVTRQISLAKKFFLYSKIALKPTKEQLDTAQKLSSSLFDPNVWYLLAQSDPNSQSFLTASTFSHHIYFIRTGIQNITAGSLERRRIDGLCSQFGLRNLNRQYGQLMDDLKSSNHRYNLKLDHLSNWRHNPHARMCTLLQLANHHYDNLKKQTPQEAANFIQQFLSKSLGSTLFYNTLKQRFAFPGVLHNFIELMDKANQKSFPIQSRDLEAIKRLYHAQLIKIIKQSERSTFSHYYQEHIDMIELNRAIIPFNQEVYGLPNIGSCAAKSLHYQAMRRFEKQKDYLRIQIETFLKFNKSGGVQVVANYLELPHLADLKVTTNNDQCTVVLFRNYQNEPNHFLNYKQSEMQRDAQQHWRKKGFSVYIVKCEKDLEEFIKKITKQPNPALK